MIYYEWDIETVDEHGDIIDHDFIDAPRLPAKENERLVLVFNKGDDNEGLLDRSWAYVIDGKLPEEFENGRRVPKRFHEQLEELR